MADEPTPTRSLWLKPDGTVRSPRERDLAKAQECYYAAGGVSSQWIGRDASPGAEVWYWRRAAMLWRDRAEQGAAPPEPRAAGTVQSAAAVEEQGPRLRVVLAGYEPEHEQHMPASWRRVKWRARRAYGRHDNETANVVNRDLERLWLSPSCLPVGGAL